MKVRRRVFSALVLCGALVPIVQAGATGAGEARQGAIGLTIGGTAKGSIIPGGTPVTLTVTVRPASLLGQGVVELRGVKNVNGGNKSIAERLKNSPDRTWRCTRTPCRIQFRSRAAAVWDFRAVRLRGSRIIEWSPRTIRVVWHTTVRSLELTGPNGLKCVRRLPSPEGSEICTGLANNRLSREPIFWVPDHTPVTVTARSIPDLPYDWALTIEEGTRVACTVPQQHPSLHDVCRAVITGNRPAGTPRVNIQTSFFANLHTADASGKPDGKGVKIALILWWGCPIGGYIPQCP